jgi:hypothetical protein
MNDENLRLTSAIAAIHNHLHAGDINAAHAACECALSGEPVRQPNLTLPQTATAATFAHRFNEFCMEYDFEAAYLLLLPSATVPGATSCQTGGAIRPLQDDRRSIPAPQHVSGRARDP